MRHCAPGFGLARQILVMVKWIAPGPENKPDRRVLIIRAVIAEGFTRPLKQVRNARHRDEVRYPCTPLRERRPGKAGIGIAHHASRSVPHAEPAARHPDLAKHRGQRHQHPVGLLAMMRALQGPGRIEHRSLARHPGGKIHDHPRGDSRNSACPRCILGQAVGLSRQVTLEPIEPDAIALQKNAIMPPVSM